MRGGISGFSTISRGGSLKTNFTARRSHQLFAAAYALPLRGITTTLPPSACPAATGNR